MRNLAAEGKSILFISHKLNEIMAVADRCSVLRKGKYIGTVNIADTTKAELSRMMVGRDVEFAVTKGEAHPGEVVLDVKNLTVPSKVHKNNAVKDVSFRYTQGKSSASRALTATARASWCMPYPVWSPRPAARSPCAAWTSPTPPSAGAAPWA